MKIAFLCSEYPPEKHGGIGTFTHMMAHELAQRDHSVRVAGLYSAESGGQTESSGQISVHKLTVPSFRGGWALARLRLYRLVAGWAHRGEIDLVEAPDYEGLTALWPSLEVPLVVRLHGSATYFCREVGQQPRRHAEMMERAGLKRADFCCSVSRYTARRTAETLYPKLKVDEVLYNGIERAEAASQGRSTNRVVFTGTLVAKKGIFELAAAWTQVQHKVPNAELHLFGRDGRAPDGGLSSEWLAKRLAPWWGRTVIYHGFADRSKIFEALRGARAAVFPSLSEAFALAPLESMARGCVTIYSKLSSGPELVTDEENGLLVDPRNPAEVEKALVRVLTDNVLAERLSIQGRRHVENNFLANYWTDRNEQFYSRCIRDFQERRQRPTLRRATTPPEVVGEYGNRK